MEFPDVALRGLRRIAANDDDEMIRAVRNLPIPKEFNFPPRVIDSTNYKELDVPDAERECPKWETIIRS